jgi:iron complex outermembrane receptor protein
VEVEGRWQARPRLRLSAAYAYTDAKFREGTLAGSPFAIGTNLSIEGKTVPLVPRHKLNLAGSWDVRPRTRVSAMVTALSEQVLDNDEPNTLGHRIPAFTVVDAKVSQELRWGRLAFTVNNLFNQKYYTYAVRSAFTTDRYAVYPLPGVTLGAQAEIRL